jgi:DNA-binding response OmpR family regulator
MVDGQLHILLVEDEPQLAALVRDGLQSAGYRVSVAGDGNTALALHDQGGADLVVLDWMLPGLDGLEVCRRIRTSSITPILMLTARAEEIDRVLGLEVGADDYLTKPFSMRELLARTRALLRRVDLMRAHASSDAHSSDTHTITVAEMRIDVDGRTVTARDRPVDLTPKEFDLLHILAEHPGRAYSRDFLLERIWGHEYVGFDRTVDTHIVRLRRKLGDLGERIVTVWGIGYKLRGD